MSPGINFDRSKQVTLLVLILAIAGLAAICFAMENINPVELNIEGIEDSMVGKLVKISGKIDGIKESKSGNFYWTVDDGSKITVPILDGKFKKLTPKLGDLVEVVGLVTKYNEELEVMPKEIYIR